MDLFETNRLFVVVTPVTLVLLNVLTPETFTLVASRVVIVAIPVVEPNVDKIPLLTLDALIVVAVAVPIPKVEMLPDTIVATPA